MPKAAARSWRRPWVLLGLSLALAACVSHTVRQRPVVDALERQSPGQALAALDEVRGDEDGDLAFLLDKGMLLRMVGRYRESIEYFERAKDVAEELDALSLREQAGSLIVNDRVRAYAGERFERALVHVYEALDYLELGKADEARVEILQAGLLRQGEDEAEPDSVFADYLSGMVFESFGEWSDAMIAYRRAFEGYERLRRSGGGRSILPVDALGPPLLRLAGHLGLDDELKAYAARFPDAGRPGLEDYRRQGDLVFLLHNGLAPAKHEVFVDHYDPVSDHVFRIALPEYGPSRRVVDHARLRIGDGPVVVSEVVDDVEATARRTLERQRPLILARAIARAVAKWRMAEELREKQGDLAGLFADLAGLVSERADTRGWQTLPAEIQMVRRSLPPGRYPVVVELVGDDGRVVARRRSDVVLEAGRQTYLEWHWTRRRPDTDEETGRG